jgi:7,8-dihydropterin-6-yl-methyl-4-(beta-D-ribofuranosyl)aminobenzene 5'-phosphate synthase
MDAIAKNDSITALGSLQLTVVYDNNQWDERLDTAWGFSCLVQGTEKTVLFDTGGNGQLLIANLEKLDIDPRGIDTVVISHVHADHAGGLGAVLEKNKEPVVYYPSSFPESFKEAVINYGTDAVAVQKPCRVCRGVWSVGELGTRLKEQSLMIQTEHGLIVITGCAHPGIIETIRAARKLGKADVLLALGGFHLRSADGTEMAGIIAGFRAMNVNCVGPCHCTGDNARKLFEQEYGGNYIHVGVGKSIGGLNKRLLRVDEK